MANKIIIPTIFGDRYINEWIARYVILLSKENPNLVCLVEGATQDTNLTSFARPISSEYIEFFKKVYDSLLDGILSQDQKQALYFFFDSEELSFMPYIYMVYRIAYVMKCLGIENEIESEYYYENDGSKLIFDTCKQWLDSGFIIPDLSRHNDIYNNIMSYQEDCVVIVEFSRVLDWLEKGLLDGDLIDNNVLVICPIYSSVMENAITNQTKIYGHQRFAASFVYDEELFNKLYKELQSFSKLKCVDIEDAINIEPPVYLDPGDNVEEIICALGNCLITENNLT